MSEKHHYAVIGRIPGDDEDSLYTFFVENVGEALELFEEAIYADSGLEMPADDNDEAKVFHTHILQSDSAMELV